MAQAQVSVDNGATRISEDNQKPIATDGMNSSFQAGT